MNHKQQAWLIIIIAFLLVGWIAGQNDQPSRGDEHDNYRYRPARK